MDCHLPPALGSGESAVRARPTGSDTMIPDITWPLKKDDLLPNDTPVIQFMDLPTEIRLHIYKWCRDLAGKLLIQIAYRSGRCQAAYRPILFPKLLLVSRMFYSESMPIYYQSKSFEFLSLDIMYVFLETIGPRQASFIRSISFVYSPNVPRSVSALGALSWCTSLQSLSIRLWISLMEGETTHYDGKPLMAARDIQKLSQLRGLTSVEVLARYLGHHSKYLKHLRHFEDALQRIKQPRNARTIRRRCCVEEGRANVCWRV